MAKQTPYKMTKLSEITPYDRNPRIIPQAAVDAVAKSIQAFGFRQPIVVDGKGVILAGHTRYKAAVQLGLEEVPVVWQTDISEIQAKGYRIADNKTAEISAWDRDQLDKEVQEIAAECVFDVDSLGLAEWELHRILEKDTDITSQFDDAPKPSYTQVYSPYESDEQTHQPPVTCAKDAPSTPSQSTFSSMLLIFENSEDRDEFYSLTKARGSITWSSLKQAISEK